MGVRVDAREGRAYARARTAIGPRPGRRRRRRHGLLAGPLSAFAVVLVVTGRSVEGGDGRARRRQLHRLEHERRGGREPRRRRSAATAGGACTLRAAIQQTNALAGADTIVLPRGDVRARDRRREPEPRQRRRPRRHGQPHDRRQPGRDRRSSTAGARPRARRRRCTGSTGCSRSRSTARRSSSRRLTLREGWAAEYGGAIMNSSLATVRVLDSTLTRQRRGQDRRGDRQPLRRHGRGRATRRSPTTTPPKRAARSTTTAAAR